MASGGTGSVTQGKRSGGPFWPWSTRAAIAAVPIILLGLIVLVSASRTWADWPSPASETLVLAGLALFALLPVLLLVLEILAGRGGSVEGFGVRIRFAEAQSSRQEVAVPPMLGLQKGMALSDSNTNQILDTLRSAGQSKVAVLDLEDGEAWWETRLLVLCAGAVRLQRPQAIVFVATAGGTAGVFEGWAPPEALLRCLLQRRPDLRTAFDQAAAIHRQWDLVPVPAVPAAPPGAVQTPFPVDHSLGSSFVVFPDGVTRNALAAEQMLAQLLGPIEGNKEQGNITTTRLNDLFDPVLHRISVDLDDPDTGTTWTAKILDTTDPFVAVTHQQVYAGLLQRDAAINDILRSLTNAAAAPS